MEQAGVSILVCTRDRATAVVNCLAGLAEAVTAHPETASEVVIVDNGSTDKTAEVLRAWADAQSFPVRLVYEPEPGLARARNAGLKVASHDIIAMTDDDCVVSRDYLAQIVAAHADCASPSIVGGRVDLGDPQDLPITVRQGAERLTYDPSKLKPGGFVIGANLTLRRAVYEKVGPFDERFGAGARFIASEDSDFVFRATFAGVPVVFNPTIVVQHFHGRRRVEDARKLQRGYAFGTGALYAKHLLHGRYVAQYLGRALKDAVRECIYPSRGDPTDLRWFHWFRLTHITRGFVAYLKEAPRNRAPTDRFAG